MRVAVVGLGKIGLPLAAQYAHAGAQVIGVDIDERTVAAVNAAQEPFPGEAHLGEYLARLVPSGRLRATTSYREAISQAETVVVVVPLVVAEDSGAPDFTMMDQATSSLGEYLQPGTLVCYETTVPVGTVRSRFTPLLAERSGLRPEEDFQVVFSPERVLTGRVFADLARYPKLIGALSPAGARRARAFYEEVLTFSPRPDLPRPNGVWDLGSAEAAELAKLAETTYRDVNIALANQFAIYADTVGINLAEVIDACNSQPYSHIHRPGIAVGGHCIPVYPRLYLSGDPEASVVRTARAVNAAMPAYAVTRAESVLGSLRGVSAVVLGAAYRGGVKETAFSGVFATVAELEKRGAQVTVDDPLYDDDELRAFGFTPYRWGSGAQLAIIQADHARYQHLTPQDIPGIKLLIDGRDVTDPLSWERVPRLVIGGGQLAPTAP